jgi:hypothetical protein
MRTLIRIWQNDADHTGSGSTPLSGAMSLVKKYVTKVDFYHPQLCILNNIVLALLLFSAILEKL